VTNSKLPQLELSARQWDALGQIRRLEDRGLTAARQVGGIHLATLKPLEAFGLITISEHADRDRHGRRWVARLTDAGRHATEVETA
jgi:DNA-binding MarR family transcriptional regulator